MCISLDYIYITKMVHGSYNVKFIYSLEENYGQNCSYFHVAKKLSKALCSDLLYCLARKSIFGGSSLFSSWRNWFVFSPLNHLTRLQTRGYFIELTRLDSFQFYIFYTELHPDRTINFTSKHSNSFTPLSVSKVWFSLHRFSRNAQSLSKVSLTPYRTVCNRANVVESVGKISFTSSS